VAVPFTNDRSRVLDVLDRTEAFGKTALNDAVAVSPEFASRGKNEKRALLLITDGIENDSQATPELALEIARRVDVPIYTIGYSLPLGEQLLAKCTRLEATPAGIIATRPVFARRAAGRSSSTRRRNCGRRCSRSGGMGHQHHHRLYSYVSAGRRIPHPGDGQEEEIPGPGPPGY
jgi:hypothetical protein